LLAVTTQYTVQMPIYTGTVTYLLIVEYRPKWGHPGCVTNIYKGNQYFLSCVVAKLICDILCVILNLPFRALALLVWSGNMKGIRPVENWVLVCWWWQFDWSFAHLMAAVVTTTSVILFQRSPEWKHSGTG